jgi:hypothetical protein
MYPWLQYYRVELRIFFQNGDYAGLLDIPSVVMLLRVGMQ